MKRELYSIVLLPNAENLEFIKTLKLALKREINWYSSVNAIGHVTVCQFLATDKELERVTKYILRVCANTQSSEIVFDKLASFPKVLYAAPDDSSEIFMKDIIKRFSKSLPISDKYTSSIPHLTFGKNLETDKVVRGFRLLENAFSSFSFNCKSVFLRKFNPAIKQFDIMQEFVFGDSDNGDPMARQLSLF